MLTTGQDTQQMINSAQAQDRYNKSWSEQQAQNQMQFQTQSNAKAMAFSAAEAQKNREFQQYNSDTAHQREVKDLIKAGLNPVLSSKYGGASSPAGNSAQGVSSSGAKGDTDGSMVNMFSGMMNAIIGQATALQTTSMNNQTSLETMRMQNQISEMIAKIGASAQLGTANINASSNQYMQRQLQSFEEMMKQKYPQTVTGGVSSMIQNMIDAFNNGSPSSSKTNSETSKIISHMQESFKNPDYGIFNKFFKKDK